jgi:dsDNA-binding SOS-regulon protein
MFQNKKDADEYDKMLELAESIGQFLEQNVPSLSEAQTEAIGLLLARRREALVKACKGRPEALFEQGEEPQVEPFAVLPKKS